MSTVASLIDFDADESPKWRTKGAEVPSVKKMIENIVKYQNRWSEYKKSTNKETLDKVLHKSLIDFIYYVNNEEEHGYDTKEEIESCLEANNTSERPPDIKGIETLNLREAYQFLLNKVKNVEESEDVEKVHGLLEQSLMKETHKLIMKDVTKPNVTEPGKYSEHRRFTTYKGVEYEYAKPEDIERKVYVIVNNHNGLMKYHVKDEKDPNVRVYVMFKICSWLLFELLDVHPFGDGNGRLCRLLCSYVLSSMTPFPTPIYNVWTESKKDDYIEALVETRESKTRHPTSLTTMIIESNYYCWKKFIKILESIDSSQSEIKNNTE
ncbi:uncharacterized protein LOC114541946 [Dendronephthya gigantea]|uniref:uncharacterized protein LOC114541946 n=1 Tax=Dendronephthya gigantea TaxID=151771 RepID=UPI00106A6C59|nr:uncharacterized protein LOC114541946 [Dendronephthya gigantea]